MIAPLRLDFEVDCSAEHAFHTWTARIDRWWPTDHTASGQPDAHIVLEARVGGRIYERTADSTEHDWGEVTVWDPPRTLGYLWHFRRDRSDATDVLIRFVPVGPRTRIEIEHGGWERLGSEGPDWRERNFGGWQGLLPHFEAAVVEDRTGEKETGP
jgi:hypothetical protein